MNMKQKKAATEAKKAARLWANELHRWKTMSVIQLDARLLRITKPEKLQFFIRAAKKYGQKILVRNAQLKLRIVNDTLHCS